MRSSGSRDTGALHTDDLVRSDPSIEPGHGCRRVRMARRRPPETRAKVHDHKDLVRGVVAAVASSGHCRLPRSFMKPCRSQRSLAV
jgi:hypothetical protein